MGVSLIGSGFHICSSNLCAFLWDPRPVRVTGLYWDLRKGSSTQDPMR